VFLYSMVNSNKLPVPCPYCPKTKNYQFYSPDQVDSHFKAFKDHPDDPIKLKQKIRSAMNSDTGSNQNRILDPNTGSDQLPTEKRIIDMWSDRNFPEFNYTDEVPVHVSNERPDTKRIDVVMFETWPFNDHSEYLREAIYQGAYNRMTGSFRSKEKQVQFILSNTKNPAKVSLFEAKRQLDFSSIGQILSYSEFFTEYYSDCGDIDIVERGIIYGKDDELCRRTAELYNIALYPVDWK